jgi:uncharacterized protein DUF6476
LPCHPASSPLPGKFDPVRSLKIAVIVMGVMLVVGTVALIAAIAARVSHKPAEPATKPAFIAQPIDLPPGARIEAMTAGSDRLIVDLLLADGTRQLLIIDLATGQRLGTIPLRIAP